MFSSPLVRLFAGQTRTGTEGPVRVFFARGKVRFKTDGCIAGNPFRPRPAAPAPIVRAMRATPVTRLVITALILASSVGAASNYREITKAVGDDTLLANAGIE